jgi:hypothetical protein
MFTRIDFIQLFKLILGEHTNDAIKAIYCSSENVEDYEDQ